MWVALAVGGRCTHTNIIYIYIHTTLGPTMAEPQAWVQPSGFAWVQSIVIKIDRRKGIVRAGCREGIVLRALSVGSHRVFPPIFLQRWIWPTIPPKRRFPLRTFFSGSELNLRFGVSQSPLGKRHENDLDSG